MDYTLVHYNAKVKTTPLSLAYVIFEQACQSLSQYGSCMASMKISSLNVCQMTLVSTRNMESVRFGARILYNYPHGLLDYPRLLFGMSFERSMIRVLDVRIKHLENFPLFMTDIVVDKKDYVPLWASFWRDPKKNSIPPPPSPSTVKKKKKKIKVHPLFGLCCEVPSTIKKTKIKVHPLCGLCCEVPSTVKKTKIKVHPLCGLCCEVPSIV